MWQNLPIDVLTMETVLNPTADQISRRQFQILTAPGPGAVAVLELTCDSADVAQFVLRRVSTTGRPGAWMEIGRICYGRWNEEDLVVVRTSWTTWEVQCHGGLVAVQRICGDLRHDGFTEQANIAVIDTAEEYESIDSRVRNGIHQAIRAALPEAGSRKTAGLILAQASNALCNDLTLLQTAAGIAADVESVRKRLAGWREVARHLTEPRRVVLVGPPNVGKSSLMNAIAGMERSIVCDQPGTTRDVVEVDAVIDGWPFRFVDTAGLRESTHDQIEEHGIRQSILAASECDVLCIVIDQTSDSENWITGLAAASLPQHRVILRNKSDLPVSHNDGLLDRLPEALSSLPVLNVSAHTGHGLPELLQWIRHTVVPNEPDRTTALPLATLPNDVFLA